MRSMLPAIVACGVARLISVGSPAAEPSLRDVLRRAGEYVTQYHAAMTSVVAEERYVQRFISHRKTGAQAGVVTWDEQRTLVSDFVLVSGGRGEPRFMAFRDVLEVDGIAVRDHDDRLQKLFASGGDGLDRAVALSRDSARYNIGPEGFLRTINVPTVALEFLLPETRDRFAFDRRRARGEGRSEDLWDIEYNEKRRPTVIRTPDGASVPARGSFRISPGDGRVVESTLELWDRRATITVFYDVDPRLRIAVPVTMRERYQLGSDEVTGEGTYSKYRRFETGVRIIPK